MLFCLQTLDHLPLTHPEHFGTPVVRKTPKSKAQSTATGYVQHLYFIDFFAKWHNFLAWCWHMMVGGACKIWQLIFLPTLHGLMASIWLRCKWSGNVKICGWNLSS